MLTNVLATHVSAGRAREALAAANVRGYISTVGTVCAVSGCVCGLNITRLRRIWQSPVAKSSYTYEIAYNTACALIDSGDYEAAKRTLKTAHGKRKCVYMYVCTCVCV